LFAFQHARGAVDIAFTDRHGGTSGGPYASLNLGGPTDDPTDVAENTRRVLDAFAPATQPSPLVRMRQVHGAEVQVVDRDYLTRPAGPAPTVDAVVTALPDVVLMVRAADCVPVLVADVARGVVGAAHAGRVGMVAGVVANTVAAMRDLGARDLTAWIGPHVCGRCYEVPAQMRAEVSEGVPEAFAQTAWGTPGLDVGAGVAAQLRRAGADVVEVSRCTLEDQDLFSYRRQGRESGRLAGLIRVRT
jgi:polyphenol oxidase